MCRHLKKIPELSQGEIPRVVQVCSIEEPDILTVLTAKQIFNKKTMEIMKKKIWNLFGWKIRKVPKKVSFFCCFWHVLVDVLVHVSQNKLNHVVFSSPHPGMKKTRIKTLLCIGQSSFMTDTGCISQSLGCLTTSEAMMCFFYRVLVYTYTPAVPRSEIKESGGRHYSIFH